MRRPFYVVRRWLAEIVEACPDKLAYHIRQILLVYPVIFGQVRPTAVLYVIRRRLHIGVLSHRFALYWEFVHPTRANSRGCLTTQQQALWQFLIGFLVLKRTVIKTYQLHSSCHIVAQDVVRSVHTIAHRACRVELLYDAL